MSRSRLAVVTGASAGIGREFAEQLAARGYDLLLVSRDGPRLAALEAALEERHEIQAEVFTGDLSRDEDVSRLAERISGEPRLSLLVNNAGFGTTGTLAAADPERQAMMVRLHALAPMRLTQAALPVLLRRREGAVINVSSVACFIYSAGNANYCATKAYLTTFTEAVAVELSGTGVQAQALCPGFTRSEFHRRMEVETNHLPGYMWLSATKVVRASLRSLDHRGPVVCVPGLGYRLLVAVLRHCPRRLIGWATAQRRDRV